VCGCGGGGGGQRVGRGGSRGGVGICGMRGRGGRAVTIARSGSPYEEVWCPLCRVKTFERPGDRGGTILGVDEKKTSGTSKNQSV